MDYQEYKKKLDTLVKKANDLNSEILKRKTRYDMHVKQLKEQFAISPEEIESTLAGMKTKLSEEEEKLQTNLGKIEEMVNKLEISLNEE